MAKIKTSQRAKNHRYNPTNAQTVNDQKNATGEQAAIDQATDAIGNIVAITASPEQIIRDIASDNLQTKILAIASISAAANAEQVRPLLKLNISRILLDLLADAQMDVVVETTGSFRNMLAIVPDDTLAEWINIGLLHALQAVLPRAAGYFANATDAKKAKAMNLDKIYDLVDNAFTVFTFLVEFSDKAAQQFTESEVQFAINLLESDMHVPWPTVALLGEFLYCVSDIESCTPSNAELVMTAVAAIIEKVDHTKRPEGVNEWINTLLASFFWSLNCKVGQMNPQLFKALTMPLRQSLGVSSIFSLAVTDNDLSRLPDDFTEWSETCSKVVALQYRIRSVQLSLESLVKVANLCDAETNVDVAMEEEIDEEPMGEITEDDMNEDFVDEGLAGSNGTSSEKTVELATWLSIDKLFEVIASGLTQNQAKTIILSPESAEWLKTLRQDMTQIQCRAFVAINAIFSTATEDSIKVLDTTYGESWRNDMFEPVFQMLMKDIAPVLAHSMSDIKRTALTEAESIIDGSLTMIWTMGRVSIDKCKYYPSPLSHVDMVKQYILLYQALHTPSQCLLRMKVVSVLGVLGAHPQLTSSVASDLGNFLISQMEQKETSAVALSEVVNAFLDIFGPDTHNHVFDQSGYLGRLQASVPFLKQSVKRVDPRIKIGVTELPGSSDADLNRHLTDGRIVRERMREMYVNMTRFVAYKSKQLKQ